MSVRHLDSLFAPRCVAVIGASAKPGNLGAIVLRNLRDGGFAGPVWPVNLHNGEVEGMTIVTSVAALPQPPDLAVVCTPPATVPGVIEELAKAGTRAATVLTAGLKEPFGDSGKTIEQAMLDAARPSVLRILGPNCLGALVPRLQLNASFAPGQALPGSLAFVTQSGALATAMLDWANAQRIGFSHYVSLGDSGDVDFGDMLDYLGSDGDTRAILMYMESVKHARKFMSAARAAARNKPVILVKAGRAPEGAKAAASHTGAMAGSDAVFDAAVKRAGMLRVPALQDLFDAAETLAYTRRWQGERLAILTNGGGAGVLAADALALGGGRMAKLSDETLAALDAFLPATWPHANPVDIIGDAPVERYRRALEVLIAAPEVDGVLFMHAPTAIVPASDIADACIPIARESAKPVLACWLGGVTVARAHDRFESAGIPCYATPERAVDAWLHLSNYHANQQALLELPESGADHEGIDADAAKETIAEVLADGREWLDAAEAARVLQAFGIPTLDTVHVHDAEEAVAAAENMGYPVAIKIVSREIVHKSDVGGVALGLESAQAVHDAAVCMRQNIARLAPHAHFGGFTVQAMANRPKAYELIAGIASDPVFGPVVLFGEGGTTVELRKDRAMGLPPLNAKLARDLVTGTQVGKLLAGYRGQAAADGGALLDVLQRVSHIACELPAVTELDINPLLADADGVVAVDMRIRVRAVKEGEPSRLALRPYPRELEQRIALDGRELLLRPIRPDDGARLAAFYAAASPADLRLRFFLARREVPRSELARYCQIDYEREMTFVAMDGEVIAGEARAVCDPDNVQSEFAVQVAGDWQHHGLGCLLLAHLVDYLRSRGTAEVLGYCLLENTGMSTMARHMGFEVRARDEDTFEMRMQLSSR